MQKNNFLLQAQRLPVLDWKITFFGAHTQVVEKNWAVPQEKHMAFEIIYIMRGLEEIMIDNTTYHAQAGTIIIIPPGFLHTILPIRSEAGAEYFCAHFDIDDASFVKNMVQYCDVCIDAQHVLNEPLKNIVQKWLELIQQKTFFDFSTKMNVQIILSELLIVLHKYTHTIKLDQRQTSLNDAKYAKEIAECIKTEFKKTLFSENNLSFQRLKIEEIIQSVGLNPNYGYQLFKRIYGFSPREYLSRLIINEAKTLLLKPDLSINQISQTLNYKNANHFSRQFKRWVGVSPSAFKKAHSV